MKSQGNMTWINMPCHHVTCSQHFKMACHDKNTRRDFKLLLFVFFLGS
jgi:hypothetical protein